MSQRPSRLLVMLCAGVLACSTMFPVAPAVAATPASTTTAKPAAAKVYSQQDLDELLAPVALHPDPLLAQILMASTYPLDVVEAQRWRKANPKLEGKALEDALAKKAWDPSVKSLATFPTVLDMMSERLDWTQKLGDAVLGQQKAVMSTVQRLRGKAMEAGTLADSEQQRVTSTSEGGTTIIKIEPADPQVVYVPTYNPAVVYGTWWYPYPPPYYYYPVGYMPGAAFFSFTAGVIIGGAFWGNCNWGGGDINIDVDRYNRVTHHDRNAADGVRDGKWQHRPEQRRGVPYRGEGAQQRFGATQVADNKARDAYRGQAERGRQDLGLQGDRAGQRPTSADRSLGDRPNAGSMDRVSEHRAATSDRTRGLSDSGDWSPAGDLSRGDSARSLDRGNSLSDRSTGSRDFSSRSFSGRSGAGGGARGGGGFRR
ncbi:DUF3300 domain-containing protein [Niveibacterium sp. SC-1]|uniref:DUF3300 domain-containing protein n=1 Tax=Niveibacterium sp. SC-1 TaxID=3135646 RepID=UPI00311F1EC2